MPHRGQQRGRSTRLKISRRRPALISAAIEALECRRLFVNSAWAFPGADGHMLYQPQPLGDHVEDFGMAGYMGGTTPMPTAAVKATVSPIAGDNTANIQNAINAVAALPQDSTGMRGAVLLNPGTYPIDGILNINASGVVLRGSGAGQTFIYGTTNTDKTERTLINVNGSSTQTLSNTKNITDKYVPVGAISFTVNDASGFSVGDNVIVHRPSTQQWIDDLGMNLLTFPWTPGSKDIDMDRTITHIDGNVITIDAPITQALDVKYTDASQGTNTISKYTATGRLSNVGIENIGGISQYDPTVTDPTDGPVDENHPWIFINVDGAINSWVRNVTSQFFGYACVDVTNSKFVTVQDSQCLDPISQITGGRRYSFTIDGSQDTLVRNCYTREGRHDYVEGSTVTGPNVFVDDRADAEHADAGPHHRYSTAALWDNLTVGQLDIQNRGNSGTGHGWAGANQVIWNSKANSFIVQNPPAAQNWLIGSVGAIANGTMYVGPHDPGIYDSSGSSGVNVAQRSLYYQQLSERTAYENFALRESRLGDNDGFVTGDAADAVPVDATWKSSIQTATGKTGVEFDAASDGQLVPFTFNFNLDPNTYIVGASLSLGLKSTGGGTSGDAIYIEDKSRQYTWAQLGVAAPTTTEAGVVIDLSKLIPALQDGRLNLAILGNTTLDWATLNFQTASTTQPTATTLTASEDATVQDGSSANSNFANATTLQTKLDTVNNDQEAFLKWDLSSLSASGFITRATIRLVPTTVGYAPDTFNSGKGAIFNQLSFVSDDTWTEGGITWNNKPAAGATVAEFISKANAPINVDVTALVRAALAGDRKLSLKLLSIVQDSAGQISYASSENGTASLRPQLIISTYGSALTPVADAYVRDGSSANTNFGSATDLETKKDSAANSGNNRDGYLKFDLTSIATAPAGATVRLMPIQVGAQLPETADFVTTDSWTESGITWNNKPANTTALGSFNVWQATPVKFSVGPQVASTIAGDKLLSVHLGTATANSGVNFFASREYADGSTVPLLILKNLGPQITSIQNQSGGVNQLVSSEWFGIWDAETAAGSLAVSAISSNTTLLPNANITFSGTTGDRFFTLTPASEQTGSTNVTITVTDAQGQTATSVFSYIVSSTLAINGDQDSAGENDVFRVVRNGTFVDIYRNNTVTPAFHMDYASAPQLLINTLGGNDIVTVDYSGGNPVPAAGIIVDGGTGNDTVAASGGAGADAVTLAAGTVSVNGGQFSYANAEELDLAAGTGGDTIAATGNASVSTSLFNVTVTGGTLSMAASNTLPDFTDMVVSSGATFSLNGQNETIDSLTGSGTVNDNNGTAATLSAGQGGSSFTFAGVLANGATGTFSLAKVGAGSFTLSGANTFTGSTTITAGEIASGISASFAGLAGQVFFNGGAFHVTADTTAANVTNKFTTTFTGATSGSTGTFNIDAGVTLTIGGANPSLQTNKSGGPHGGDFTKTGAGTLRIVGNNSQQDNVLHLNAGTIDLESATGIGGGDAGVRLDAKTGTTLILKQDAATSFLTPINVVDPGGSISIVLDRLTSGAGVAHLINALTSAGAFTVHVSTGANVASGTEGLTLGSITMSGNGVLDVVDGASASTLVTVTGVVGGAFTLTKTGSGDMALNTVNTYSGDTTVSGGSLTIASAGSIASANVTVSAGATLSINGSLASSVAISDSGVVNFAGNPGTSAFTRAVGTLNVQHGGSAVALDSAFAMQAGVSQITTLTFADTTAKLDLRNNELIVNNALPAVRTQIILGEIFTTTAGGVIGYKDLGSGQTEARYALRGDANLDGTVDVSDLGALATSYGNSTGQLWVQGDFNNDGSVDVADLGALASSYGVSLASGLQAARLITAAAAATVASPASAASAIPRTALSNDAVRTTSYWIAGASPFGQNDRTVAWIFGDSRRDKLRPN